jgi:hypothetical protein
VGAIAGNAVDTGIDDNAGTTATGGNEPSCEAVRLVASLAPARSEVELEKAITEAQATQMTKPLAANSERFDDRGGGAGGKGTSRTADIGEDAV